MKNNDISEPIVGQDFIMLEECPSCTAALGPCNDFPWHYPEEDCRATHAPLVPSHG